MVHTDLQDSLDREVKPSPSRNSRTRRHGLSIWGDRPALLLLVLAFVADAALAVYVFLEIPSLPFLLPLHYNGFGGVDLIGPRADLFKMPGIGLVVLLADLVGASFTHRRDRLGALILLGTALLVQAMLIVATLNVVRLAFGD